MPRLPGDKNWRQITRGGARPACAPLYVPPPPPPRGGTTGARVRVAGWWGARVATGVLLRRRDEVPEWAVEWSRHNTEWPEWITFRHLYLDAKTRDELHDLTPSFFANVMSEILPDLQRGQIVKEDRNSRGTLIQRRHYTTWFLEDFQTEWVDRGSTRMLK